MSASRGQASVELVALLPLAAAVGLGCAQLLAAGLSLELAGHAAEAAAIALVREADPQAAARASLPGWAADRVDVETRGRRVRVRLPPPAVVPVLHRELTATATADAGPMP